MLSRTFQAMGSRINVLLDADGAAAESLLAEPPAWFAKWEQALSRFIPGSELNRLAANGAGWQPASAILLDAAAAARRADDESDGLVNPFLLDALEIAGYTQSFETLADGAAKSPEAGTAGRVHGISGTAIRIDNQRGRVWIPPGVRLDLGGTAKGWAAERACARLAAFGPALVDAGGDIAVSGPRADGSPWIVDVGNPFGGGESICRIALSGGGVATSGRDYRRWERAGRPMHHIIDPRTLEPARTDVLTATVIASDAVRAETGAKAAFILGSREGLAWLDDRPELAGLLILEDGRMAATGNWGEHMVSNVLCGESIGQGFNSPVRPVGSRAGSGLRPSE